MAVEMKYSKKSVGNGGKDRIRNAQIRKGLRQEQVTNIIKRTGLNGLDM